VSEVKKGGLMGALEGFGLIESTDDNPSAEESATPIQPTTAAPTTVAAPVAATGADPAMVEKIRVNVTSATHSPRLATFLAHLETAQQAFPNDPKAAATAALAFSKLSAAEIREELSKSAAAALIEAETAIQADIRGRREKASNELEAKSSSLQTEVTNLEEQLAAIQQKLTTSKTSLASIDGERTRTNADIDKKEATALASHTAVKAELTTLANLLS